MTPPPPKGEQPYVVPAARALAEIRRGVEAFDAAQRRMRESVPPGPFVPRPRRVRGEAAPINPQTAGRIERGS